MLDEFCTNGKIGDYSFSQIQDKIYDIDNTMRNTTATYMCTDTCLCPSDTDFGKWSETLLNQNNRTKSNVPVIVSGKTYEPMKKAASSGTQPTVYNSFWDCYSRVKDYPNFDEYYEVSEGMKELLETMESEFNCQGICKIGAFFYFKKVQDGPPNQNCLEGLKETF